MIGAKFNGQKELLAMGDGVRESEASWKKLLLELKGRGMSVDPKLAIGRRSPGLLEGVLPGVPDHRGATLLGAQERGRVGQDAQGCPTASENAGTRHLPR